MSAILDLVRRIHASSVRLVLAASGGGSRAIAELLEVPGASRCVLEATIPYCESAMTQWLGGRPDHFCSEPTSRAMAMAAFLRAGRLDPAAIHRGGVACTASLASDRPKRGPHRVHVAIQTPERTASWSLTLVKDRRSRAEEEGIASQSFLHAVAAACGLDQLPEIELSREEHIEEASITAPESWRELLLGHAAAVRQTGRERAAEAAGPSTAEVAIFPGAFNPLHEGHRRMLEIAADLLGRPVEPEISILNVDKPPLDYLEISRRLAPFDPTQPVWLTRAATFLEKSRLFPGATFVVGIDTLRRIADPRYYGDDRARCQTAIDQIAARGNRLLVFGRAEGERFIWVENLDLPEPLRSLCTSVPEERFREDISSTAIRRAWL